jgi:FixJ family two-component response regulator
VITDVRMPGIDGAEVVSRLSLLKDHDWPVIVITGHAEVPMAVQMMKAGVIDFIEKPFEQWIKRVSCRKCSAPGQEHGPENRIFTLSVGR